MLVLKIRGSRLFVASWVGLTYLICSFAAVAVAAQGTGGGESLAVTESAYYPMETVAIPNDVALEVGGLALLPSGDLAAATRRGEVWIIENPNGWGSSKPFFRRFAHGLHEPLGLTFHKGALYAAQRGELTRLKDTDGDGRADEYDTVFDWKVSGNYHEYSFGPVLREDGTMVVSLNLSTVGPMASLEKWRGWMLEISADGTMRPLATGMRSPAGIQVLSDGSLFYTDNQGDWIGSGWLAHVERGDFLGHPAGLRWSGEPGSPLSLKPEDVPDTGGTMFETAKRLPALKPPAVWLPHGVLGVSSSGILEDTTGGAFGPFAGQLFIGDQGHSKIMRAALEKVDGVYQGVVFPFREGFQSGVLRMIWDGAGAMYVGMTSRGWDATGGESYGLQRVRWSGLMPFEARSVRAMPDGFDIEFTVPVETDAALDPRSYQVTSFAYRYHSTYGSPVIHQKEHAVEAVVIAEDARSARIVVDSLREGYIYEIKMPGVRSADGDALMHPTGYFTLNRIPEGDRIAIADARRGDAVSAEGVRAEEIRRRGAVSGTETAGGESADATNDEAHAGSIAGRSDATGRALESGKAELSHRSDDIAGAANDRRSDSDAVKRVTEMPAGWDRPDLTITIGTLPGLRFDLDAFEAEPGARVEIEFRNDDDMLHNLVVVAPGTADLVASAAMELGIDGMAKEYVPVTADVLFHTSLLQPGTSESIYFTAPLEPGDYTFVCTFPGHATTMRGTLQVRP